MFPGVRTVWVHIGGVAREDHRGLRASAPLSSFLSGETWADFKKKIRALISSGI